MTDQRNPTRSARSTTDLKSLKSDLWRTTSWGVLVPVLAIWPFLSAFPIFSLIQEPGGIGRITVLLGFVGTGFWSLLALGLLWSWVRLRSPADELKPRRPLGLWIATFGALWITAYLACVYLGVI